MRILLPETIELRRNPSAFAIATNSRTDSGSRLQFTLFLFKQVHPRHPRLRGAFLRPACAFAPDEPPSPAPKRKHARIACTGMECSVAQGASAPRSRDV